MDTDEPVPPIALTARLVQAPDAWADVRGYLERGKQALRAIENVLPGDWTWANKRVLDFGCGAGRTIRHLRHVAVGGEVWGCDTDPECIAWDTEHLVPSLSFVVNDHQPPLPFESEKFDLVYALSVFTHIDTHWASWLLELHRVLAVGGLMVASIMSEGMCEAVSGQPWDESEVGMNVYECGQPWALGGPMVLHSPWWIREHWGRLFDVRLVRTRDFFDQSGRVNQDNHGVVVLQKTERCVTAAELERVDASEPKEVLALHHDVMHLRTEVAALRALLHPERVM
jgi:SAM-dependent methyltransferase